jgi:integrase
VEEVVEDISRLQLGTVIEEDVNFMDEVKQKTILGEGDVGPDLPQQQLYQQFPQYNINRPFNTGNVQPVIPQILQSFPQHPPSLHPASQPTSSTLTTTSTINYTIPSDGILPGSRLQHFLPYWKTITNHPWPLSVIQNGYKIQFTKKPIPWRNQKKTTIVEDQHHINETVQKFLDGGMIEVSPTQNPQFLSKFFTGNDKEKTDPGLPKIELVHPSRTLQDGGSSSTKRTYGKRRIHSCPNTRRLPRFFKLRERRNGLPIQIPSEQQLATWDGSILVDYINNQLSPTSTLSLAQLQLKTILLFCIATMWRPRSDIGRLQYRDVILNQDDMTTNIRIHARKPKEGQIKSIILDTVEDNQVCPVRTAHESILQTAVKRQTLTEDHTFFLTYLDSSKKQATSVRPTTVTNWIKAAMDKAGVDINHYQAHSI